MDKIDGTLIFKDKDNNLIISQKRDASWWSGLFLDTLIESEARNHGVKVITSEWNKETNTVTCLVDYLGKRKK